MEISKEQIQYAINGLSVVATALITWYATKKKEARQDKVEDGALMRSDFDALVKANKEFREEIRKDLEVAKRDLEAAKLRIAVLEKELDARAAKIIELERTIAELSK